MWKQHWLASICCWVEPWPPMKFLFTGYILTTFSMFFHGFLNNFVSFLIFLSATLVPLWVKVSLNRHWNWHLLVPLWCQFLLSFTKGVHWKVSPRSDTLTKVSLKLSPLGATLGSTLVTLSPKTSLKCHLILYQILFLKGILMFFLFSHQTFHETWWKVLHTRKKIPKTTRVYQWNGQLLHHRCYLENAT